MPITRVLKTHESYNILMSKEEIIDLIKHLILQLRDNEKALKENPRLMQDWIAKQKHLDESIKQLNSCDASWVNDNYIVWFNKEIAPHTSFISSLPKT